MLFRSEDLRRDYARAEVARIGSALLAGRAVRGAVACHGIEMRDPSAAAVELASRWARVDADAATEAWATFFRTYRQRGDIQYGALALRAAEPLAS